MGYNTDFWGSISITPPLNEHEINYLRQFAERDFMSTTTGPYAVSNRARWDEADQASPSGLSAAQHAPGSACQWIPSDDGTELEYDQQEKFYESTIWMAYLIDTFLKPGATAQHDLAHRIPGWIYPEELQHFTFDHACNGEIDAQGEDSDDRWRLVVRDNLVSTQHGAITYKFETLFASAQCTDTDTDTDEDPAGTGVGERPVLRLLAVQPDGEVAAWADPTPGRSPLGMLPPNQTPSSLAAVLDSTDLVIPPITPIVRFDLAAPIAAHLFLTADIEPNPALPARTVRQTGSPEAPFTGDPRPLSTLESVSVDLFVEFASQLGIPVQHTPRLP